MTNLNNVIKVNELANGGWVVSIPNQIEEYGAPTEVMRTEQDNTHVRDIVAIAALRTADLYKLKIRVSSFNGPSQFDMESRFLNNNGSLG